MPTIAVVDGILIILYFNDHPPPHSTLGVPRFMPASGSTMAAFSTSRVGYRLASSGVCGTGRWLIATN